MAEIIFLTLCESSATYVFVQAEKAEKCEANGKQQNYKRRKKTGGRMKMIKEDEWSDYECCVLKRRGVLVGKNQEGGN